MGFDYKSIPDRTLVNFPPFIKMFNLEFVLLKKKEITFAAQL